MKLYADPKSPSFGNATRSYIAAGYKESYNSASCAIHLLQTHNIKQALSTYEPEKALNYLNKAEITKEYTLQKLQSTYDQAERVGDRTTQVACIRLMMQYNNMLNERIVVDITDSRQLEEHKRLQARQIASIILNGGMLDQACSGPVTAQLPSIPAEFEQPDDTPDIVESDNNDDNNSDYDDNSLLDIELDI